MIYPNGDKYTGSFINDLKVFILYIIILSNKIWNLNNYINI